MDIGWKVASAASVAGAGFVADRLIDLIWKGFTGHKPPRGSEDEAVANMLEVALFGPCRDLPWHSSSVWPCVVPPNGMAARTRTL